MIYQNHTALHVSEILYEGDINRGVAAGPAGPLSHTPKTKQKNQNPQVKE